MPITVLEHSLASHLMSHLRDVHTAPDRFRMLTRSLSRLLVAEATRKLPLKQVTVQTPMEEATGSVLTDTLVLAPILRAGLGMLEASLELLPDASVGYVGLERDEETALAHSYYCKMPDLQDKTVFMLDPMLATGGSAVWAANEILSRGAAGVTLLCIVAAPQGVVRLTAAFPEMHIVAASLDRELNDKKYILPGLGDFGDRLYGTL